MHFDTEFGLLSKEENLTELIIKTTMAKENLIIKTMSIVAQVIGLERKASLKILDDEIIMCI